MKTLLLPRVERSAPPRTAIFQQLQKIMITKRIPSLATTQARRRETLMDTKEKQAVRPNTRRRRGALMRAAPQLQGRQRLRLAQAEYQEEEGSADESGATAARSTEV